MDLHQSCSNYFDWLKTWLPGGVASFTYVDKEEKRKQMNSVVLETTHRVLVFFDLVCSNHVTVCQKWPHPGGHMFYIGL